MSAGKSVEKAGPGSWPRKRKIASIVGLVEVVGVLVSDEGVARWVKFSSLKQLKVV